MARAASGAGDRASLSTLLACRCKSCCSVASSCSNCSESPSCSARALSSLIASSTAFSSCTSASSFLRCSSLSRGTSSTNSTFSISLINFSRASSSKARAFRSGGRAFSLRLPGLPDSARMALTSCIGGTDRDKASATPEASSDNSCLRKSVRSTSSACARCNCSARRSSLSSGPSIPRPSLTFSISLARRRRVFSNWFVIDTCCSGRAVSRRLSRLATCCSRI